MFAWSNGLSQRRELGFTIGSQARHSIRPNRVRILRSGGSSPVASHPASRQRGYLQLRAGERLPDRDLHPADCVHSQTHDRGRLARRCPPKSCWHRITNGYSGDRYRFEGHDFWPHPFHFSRVALARALTLQNLAPAPKYGRTHMNGYPLPGLTHGGGPNILAQ